VRGFWNCLKRWGRGERGVSTVEFALVFVLLFVVVGLILQGAFIFNGWLVITNAVTEAARRGAPCVNRPVDGCALDDVIGWAYQAAGGTDHNQLAIDAATDGSMLNVFGRYEVPLVVPFLQGMVPDPLPVSARAEMRLENQPGASFGTPVPTNTPAPTATKTPAPTSTPTPTCTPPGQGKGKGSGKC
jgi:hypothetical protein